MNYPIILQSPEREGFQFFRRINADKTIERKAIGNSWEPHEIGKLVMPVEKYLYQMTKRLGWKVISD